MAASTAIAVAIADAVEKQLKATTRTLNPVYGRTYETTRELKDNNVLHVDIVNAGHKLNPIARDTVARDPIIQVVIRKRLSNGSRADDKSELDRLNLLVEEIEDTFAQKWLDEYPATWQSCETVGPIDEPDYRVWRQFTVVISITFRADEDE